MPCNLSRSILVHHCKSCANDSKKSYATGLLLSGACRMQRHACTHGSTTVQCVTGAIDTQESTPPPPPLVFTCVCSRRSIMCQSYAVTKRMRHAQCRNLYCIAPQHSKPLHSVHTARMPDKQMPRRS